MSIMLLPLPSKSTIKNNCPKSGRILTWQTSIVNLSMPTMMRDHLCSPRKLCHLVRVAQLHRMEERFLHHATSSCSNCVTSFFRIEFQVRGTPRLGLIVENDNSAHLFRWDEVD
jgi:hypothetical protein